MDRRVRCFFFNDTATTEIYTLSLHDALPISSTSRLPDRSTESGIRTPWTPAMSMVIDMRPGTITVLNSGADRKSTRLNSSHGYISYAVFCLKKKKKKSNRVTNQSTLLPNTTI